MGEQKLSSETQKPEEETLPLGVILDRASEDVGALLFNYMGQHGIPPSLFDYVLTNAVAKIKDMKASEYAGKIGGRCDGKYSGSAE